MFIYCIDCKKSNLDNTDFENKICEYCNSLNVVLMPKNMPAIQVEYLHDISSDKHFWQAMINLYQTDIIEYELKMSQFRSQLEQQKQAKQDNQLRCPYCHSTDVKKITMTSKVTHGAVFGLFGARKILKQWHCNKCKSDF